MVAKTNQIYLLSIKLRVSLQSSVVKSGSFTAVRLHVYLVFVKSIEQELKIQ